MPRISAASNAEQRADTQRRILTAFGELLFSHGLPGLTMTDVARHAGVGRTAVYNYYADIEELLISYALDETRSFSPNCGTHWASWTIRWTGSRCTSAPRWLTSAAATCRRDPRWEPSCRRRPLPNSRTTLAS